MLAKNVLTQITNFCLYCFAFLLIAAPLYADTSTTDQTTVNLNNVSATSIITNLVAQMPYFMRFITALAYVLGFYFVVLGIFKLREYAEMRTMMSGERSIKGPLIFITVGTLLIYIPTSVQVGMATFFTSPNPYGYLKNQDQWSQFINDCFIIIQFVGVLSFIRGLVILSQLGGHGGQPGTFGRGLTHIIGGIFCINIYQFIQLLMVTLGVQY
jgi:uncharacterized membrane protein HdeD (DUF308 family)